MPPSVPITSATSATTAGEELPAAPAFRVKTWQGACSLLALAVAAFAPARGAGWTWGDGQNVSQNVLLRTWDGLGHLWVNLGGTTPYRPLAGTWLSMQYGMWGNDPSGYHVVSIALHALNALVLWKLLRMLLVPSAWLAAALFAVHPVQVQAVAWASQQGMLLATMLLLMSLAATVRWLELVPEELRFEDSVQVLPSHPLFVYAVSLLGFLGAVLADAAVAVLWPVVWLAVVWWLRPPPLTRRQRWMLTPFMGIAAVAAGLAVWNVRSTALLQFSAAGALAGAMIVDWVVPAPAVLNRLQTISATWWGAACTALALACAVGLIAWLRRRPRVRRGAVAAAAVFAAALFAAALFRGPLLQSWDVTVADTAGAYAAGAPLFVIVAALLGRLVAKASARATHAAGRLLPPALAAVLPLGLAATAALGVVPRFADVTTFWNVAAAHDSTRALALRQLGKAALEGNRPYEAERYYAAAHEFNLADADATAGLAQSLAARNQLRDAAAIYRQGLRAVPGDAKLMVGLAALEARRGNRQDAIQLYETLLGKDPSRASLHNDLGGVLLADGQSDRAIESFRKAVALDNTLLAAKLNLASALFQVGQYNESSKYLHEVIDLDPMNFQAYLNAGAMLASMKEYRKAEAMFRNAVALRKDSKEAWEKLGAALAAQSKSKEAEWCFAQAKRTGSSPTTR